MERLFLLTSKILCGVLVLVGQVASANLLPEKSAIEIEAYDRGLGQAYTQQLREMYSGEAPVAPSMLTAASLAAEASLVIEGQVQRVTYTHEGPYEQPFTIIDISVSRVLKGVFDKEVIVIRQPGGPSKNGELINIVSHAEYFVPGDGELLFIDTSGDQLLIKNRFRVHEDALYSQDGFGLMLYGSGELGLGKARNSAETFTRIVSLGSEVLRKNFSKHHDGEGEHAGHSHYVANADEEAAGTQLTVDGFAEAIRAQ
jgi:hypothetical protein